MDYPSVEFDQLKFPIPSGMVVSGPSNSGKTQWVLKLLENAQQMFTPPPKAIVWCYGQFSEVIPRLERKGWHVHEGTPNDHLLSKIPKPFILVLDDLMGDIDQKTLSDLFTKKSHHNNFSVIFLTQNLFEKHTRTARSNAQFVVLMRSPNDMLSVQNLARQLFPRENNYFLHSYRQATEHPYGYLLISLHANSPNLLRLRTNIFPGEDQVVFTPL